MSQPPQFDVFLCHNSEDKAAVIQIAEQLQRNGLKPWLDVWELQPGAIWQFALEQQIERIEAAAVFVGKQGLGPWQSEEIYAFLQEFIGRKCPVIPVMLPDVPQQPRLPIFLKNRHWVDFRLQNPDPLSQLIWGITGQKPTELNPQTSGAPAATVPIQPDARDFATSIDNPTVEIPTVDVKPVANPSPERAIPVGRPAPVPAAPAARDDLSSEKGIDYTRLQDLLKAGDWKGADRETYLRMLEAVGRKDKDWMRKEELLNFPCADLKTIDRLWVNYSQGKFGFSVQKQIYVECGAALDGEYPGDKIFYEFCNRVGWRVKNSYIPYFKLIFSTLAPTGHLPGGVGGLWDWVGDGGGLFGFSLLSHRDL